MVVKLMSKQLLSAHGARHVSWFVIFCHSGSAIVLTELQLNVRAPLVEWVGTGHRNVAKLTLQPDELDKPITYHARR